MFCGIESEDEQSVVEKYSRAGVEYLLTIPKQGSVKHGQAEMRDKSGRLIASLTFANGILSGPCILRNPNGHYSIQRQFGEWQEEWSLHRI